MDDNMQKVMSKWPIVLEISFRRLTNLKKKVFQFKFRPNAAHLIFWYQAILHSVS